METTVEVSDASQVAEVRRAVSRIGHTMGLTADLVAQASLVTNELCTNILKYAGHGELVLSTYGVGESVHGVEIMALDRGPGMADFSLASRDGFSTGGSLGIGLGTVRRAAAAFDVYTQPGLGTAILVRVADKKAPEPEPAPFVIGARMVPMRNELVSGDGWSFVRLGQSMAVAVVDGLGHGPKAAEASQAALLAFHQCIRDVGPSQALQLAHQALRATRGAVMAIATINATTGRLCYSGIGNISGVVHAADALVRLASIDGTVGYGLRKARESVVDWSRHSTLIMNSDGLSSKWNLARHPGLLHCEPALIAAVLHRDFARNTDDSTVVVVKGL